MAKAILLSTPIGNLEDITLRAKRALEEGVNFIAEDTRMLKKLMNALSVSLEGKNIFSFHDHSTKDKIDYFATLIEESENDFFLVSDAGSPLISDPMFPLLEAIHEREIFVDTYPGASSLLAALELSSLLPHPFSFHGFFPRDFKNAQLVLEGNGGVKTAIFFESPKRVKKTTRLILEKYEHLKVVLVKEITKMHQKVFHFSLDNINEIEEMNEKGEFVLLVDFRESHEMKKNFTPPELLSAAESIINSKGKKKSVAKLVSLITKQDQNEVYKMLSEGGSKK